VLGRTRSLFPSFLPLNEEEDGEDRTAAARGEARPQSSGCCFFSSSAQQSLCRLSLLLREAASLSSPRQIMGTNVEFFGPDSISISSGGLFALTSDPEWQSSAVHPLHKTRQVTRIAGKASPTTCGFNKPEGIARSVDDSFALIADSASGSFRKLDCSSPLSPTHLNNSQHSFGHREIRIAK
jgi:hypothetical protein